MSQTTAERWRRPRRSPRFRLPWQPRPNGAPEEIALARAPRKLANASRYGMLASEINAHGAKARQSAERDELAHALVTQSRPADDNANQLTSDERQRAAFLAHGVAWHERPNAPDGWLALMREHPEIDEKSAAFWFATRPNKLHRSPNDVDGELARQLDFIRYLVRRGTFNEGFDGDQAPPQYRTPFSDDDLRDLDDGMEKE